MEEITSYGESPLKGAVPYIISKSKIPSAHMSIF